MLRKDGQRKFVLVHLNNYGRTLLFLCSPPLQICFFLPSPSFLHPPFYSLVLLLPFWSPHLIISSHLISFPSPVLILLSLPLFLLLLISSCHLSYSLVLPSHFNLSCLLPFVAPPFPFYHLSFSSCPFFVSPSLSCVFPLFTSSYFSFSLFSPVLHPIFTPLPSSLSLLFLSAYLHFLSFSYFPSFVYTLSFLLSPSLHPFYSFLLFIPLLPPLSSSFSSSCFPLPSSSPLH